MTHLPSEAMAWTRFGTDRCRDALAGSAELDLDRPSLLPGWTRRHVVAHLVGNAEALLNLTTWAATGTETPMYASAQQRQAGIEAGVLLPGAELVARFEQTAARFSEAVAALSPDQLATPVRTAQGRSVPAGEVAWLRAREVCVHAVDLAGGVGFDDLPPEFLAELIAEVEAMRGGPLPQTTGGPGQRAAWLVSRPHDARLGDGSPAPDLGPWL